MATPVSGLYVGADGKVYDLTAYVRGASADTEMTADPHQYAYKSGQFVGSDGNVYDLPNILNAAKIQVSTMPTAASTLAGRILQFTGTTTSSFTHGHFYECTGSGSSYSWTEVSLGGGSVPSEVTNAITNKGMGWNVSANITWDGDTTGKETQVISDVGTFYKVSDLTPEFSGSTLDFSLSVNGTVQTVNADACSNRNSISFLIEDFVYGFIAFDANDVTLTTDEEGSEDYITLPSTGIYLRKDVIDDVAFYVSGVNFGTAESKIDKKYIPSFFVGKNYAGENNLRVGVDSDGYVYFYVPQNN